MTEPRRFQRSRAKGWTKPDNSLCVTRPGYLGNPFTVADIVAELGVDEHDARILAVQRYADWLAGRYYRGDLAARRLRVLERLPSLAGVNLGCTCDLPEPGETDWCHAAVLLACIAGGVGSEAGDE